MRLVSKIISTYWDEKIRHLPLILLPCLAILLPALLDIPHCAVDNHAAKEDRVKPGERAAETGNETPADSKEEIASVVDLACLSVPAISQNLVSVGSLDSLGVLDAAVFEVGESGALLNDTTLFLAELVLLRVGRVPDIISVEVGKSQKSGKPGREAVLGGVVVGDVESAVAVRQRHASHVPEDEHEAKLLIVHVPGCDDEVLALCAGASIEVVCE